MVRNSRFRLFRWCQGRRRVPPKFLPNQQVTTSISRGKQGKDGRPSRVRRKSSCARPTAWSTHTMLNMPDPSVLSHNSLLDWLSDVAAADGAVAPERLWHYTDAGGLIGIVRDDVLWASNARFLNDSQEVSYGISTVMETLQQFDAKQFSKSTQAFLARLADPSQEIVSDFLERSLEVFVTCFCSSGDLLSQWRGYTGQYAGGGYSIGFTPPGSLLSWPQAAPGGHGLVLRKVIYNPAQQQARIQDLIVRLASVLDQDPDDQVHRDDFAANLVDGLAEAVAWCKHPTFAEEDEWRIVYTHLNGNAPLPVEHRPSRGLVVPFVKLRLPSGVGRLATRLPIDTVYCGPSPEPDVKIRGVEGLLLPYLDQVRIEGSLSPLRLG